MSTNQSRKTTKQVANTFGDHIKELRTRLFLVAGVFFVLSLIAYAIRDVLIEVVLSPIGHQKLIYLNPTGGFNFIFSVTMYAAAVVVMPFLLFQVYQFVKPTLPAKARRYSVPVFLVATVLMCSGVLFGYFVAVPSAIHFLNTFAGDYVEASLTADSYLNFFMAYVAGLGLLFQLPLILLFWNWISPIQKGGLLNSQRYVIAGAFIVAAMITPTPDAVNQAMVAGPIIVIYQLGVIAVFNMNRRARKAAKKQQVNTKDDARPVAKQSVVTAVQPVTRSSTAPRPVAATVVNKPKVKRFSDIQPSPSTHSVRRPRPQIQARARTIDSITPMAAAVKREHAATPTVAHRSHAKVRSVDGMSIPRRPGVPTYQRKSLT
ncbi:TPA: twin-arginine translocase subunit TatC [Candidatus Saccharibacteria bacterium]|nr:twin-arginine translocase subunit TatC [Candidatus Saccharibacteria bacterium]HRJ91389.1 twin-arginine translocase subunit TatC [Candidatus Saccharibacteria bacterium]